MGYLFEMHCHTCEVSGCASTPAEQSVRLLKENGYHGVVLTNHYLREYFSDARGSRFFQRLDQWIAGYEMAHEAGEKYGVKVFLGMELRFLNAGVNDYLVYGVTPAFLRSHPYLYEMTPENFHVIAQENGLFFAQAHPFRAPCTPEPAEHLDGIEVFNGHAGHDSRNEKAYTYAKRFGLPMLVGSDFHDPWQVATTGVLFRTMPQDSQALARMLKEGAVEGYVVRGLRKKAGNALFQQDLRFQSDILTEK